MSKRDEVNSNIVYVSVDGSHEDMGQHKGICFFLAPKKPTFDLTATYNSELFSVDTNDDKYQNYQLSITDYKKIRKQRFN